MHPRPKPKSAGLGALCLLLAWLLAAGGPAVAASANQAAIQREGVGLSGFKLSRAGAAQIADRLQVEYEVKNLSGAPLRLGEKFGAFVAARWRTKTHRKLNRDFGHQAREARLAAGAGLKVRASLILDMPGIWTLWPAVQLGERIVAFEELSQEITVSFGADSGPAQPAAEPEIDDKGGQSLVIWEGQELPLQVFPPDNPWNTDVSRLPKHPMSDQWIAAIGTEMGLRAAFGSGRRSRAISATAGSGQSFGTPFSVVRLGQALVQVQFELAGQSDPGPYPIPANPPTEGSGHDHIIVVHYDEKKLYEVRKAERMGPLWYATSGAVFDLASNRLRPLGHASAAGSGLPIFPGLVRWEEVGLLKRINHALGFTAGKVQRAYMLPATRGVGDSTNPAWPPMGMRVRLKRDFDVSGFPESVQVILAALKTYGMLLTEQGKDWRLAGAPDERWLDDELDTLKNVRGRDLEVVDAGVLIQ
ncbi:MAG: hypothetical protein ACOZHQ_06360 [Thermodesulfobacteriota bacterium]